LKKVFITPDFDQKLEIVRARAGLYSTTLQVQIMQEKQQEDILEWICPNRDGYLKPKCLEENDENTCQEFLRSKEYLNWAENPRTSTFICTGQRMCPV
jgi:hypothetical protein